MALHVFLFLFVFFLIPCLARLWHLYRRHLQPSHSRVGAMHTTAQRLLKPRTPLDCPACSLSCTHSSVVGPAPSLVRPWREMKSRRGAPKRVNTQGFACPNHKCPYFGITDAHIHALVGDGKHGHAERIQTFRCQACHTTFSARRHTPLYRLKTPSHHIAMVRISRSQKGSMLPPPNGSSATVRPPSLTGCLTQPVHAQSLHERCFRNLQIPHLQLDHCCAPGYAALHRCSGCGWQSIPSRRFFPCFSSAPERKTWRICSSTPYDRFWPLAVSRSLRVMG
jgi:transposase-like protein